MLDPLYIQLEQENASYVCPECIYKMDDLYRPNTKP